MTVIAQMGSAMASNVSHYQLHAELSAVLQTHPSCQIAWWTLIVALVGSVMKESASTSDWELSLLNALMTVNAQMGSAMAANVSHTQLHADVPAVLQTQTPELSEASG